MALDVRNLPTKPEFERWTDEQFNTWVARSDKPTRDAFPEALGKPDDPDYFIETLSEIHNATFAFAEPQVQRFGDGKYYSKKLMSRAEDVDESAAQIDEHVLPPSQFEIRESPITDPQAQLDVLRTSVLPGFENGISAFDELLQTGSSGLSPAIIGLFAMFLSGRANDLGVGGSNVQSGNELALRNMINALDTVNDFDGVQDAWAFHHTFQNLQITAGDGSSMRLDDYLKSNRAYFKGTLNFDFKKECSNWFAFPASLMTLVTELIQANPQLLRQLQNAQASSTYAHVEKGVRHTQDQIRGAIKTINNLQGDDALSDFDGDDGLLELMEFFPNPEAQAYLYAQIGIDVRALGFESKPSNMSDEQWQAHQIIKQRQKTYQRCGMVKGVLTMGVMALLGVVSAIPPFTAFAAPMALALATSGAAFGMHDVYKEGLQSEVAHAAYSTGQQQGVQKLAVREDVEQADSDVLYASAKIVPEMMVGFAGMGVSARIEQTTWNGLFKFGAESLNGAGQGSLSPLFDGRNQDNMGQVALYGAAMGAAGAATGSALGHGVKSARAQKVYHKSSSDSDPKSSTRGTAKDSPKGVDSEAEVKTVLPKNAKKEPAELESRQTTDEKDSSSTKESDSLDDPNSLVQGLETSQLQEKTRNSLRGIRAEASSKFMTHALRTIDDIERRLDLLEAQNPNRRPNALDQLLADTDYQNLEVDQKTLRLLDLANHTDLNLEWQQNLGALRAIETNFGLVIQSDVNLTTDQIQFLQKELLDVQMKRPNDFAKFKKLQISLTLEDGGGEQDVAWVPSGKSRWGRLVTISSPWDKPIAGTHSFDERSYAPVPAAGETSPQFDFRYAIYHELGHVAQTDDMAYYNDLFKQNDSRGKSWAETYSTAEINAEDYRIYLESNGQEVMQTNRDGDTIPFYNERLAFFKEKYPEG